MKKEKMKIYEIAKEIIKKEEKMKKEIQKFYERKKRETNEKKERYKENLFEKFTKIEKELNLKTIQKVQKERLIYEKKKKEYIWKISKGYKRMMREMIKKELWVDYNARRKPRKNI